MRIYSSGRRRLKLMAAILAASAFMVSAVACQTPTPARPAGPLQASTTPYERDLPLPAGFELQEQSSEDFLTGPLRYLRHLYTGRADKSAVRKFYRHQMPLVRWTPVSDNLASGRYTMRFERGTETCLVTIEDEPTRPAGRVRVQVTVAPVPR